MNTFNLDDKIEDSYTVEEIVANRSFFNNTTFTDRVFGFNQNGYFEVIKNERVSISGDLKITKQL